MKKTLLFLSLLASSISFSQVLQSENFDGLNLGNIGTDVTGVTAGQGGWLTANGTNSDYQIVSETTGKSFQLTGSNTATGTRYMWKSDLPTAWAARTSGNNIINTEFDLFTGGPTTSKNTARVYIFNSDGSVVLAGLSFNLETKAISGIAYFDPNNGGVNPVGTYSFNLGTSNAVLNLTSNTWVRMGISYNTVTREVVWKGPGFYAGLTGAIPATGTVQPREVDFLMGAGTANALAGVTKFDNFVVYANNVESLLGTENFQNTNLESISIYPNPATNVLNISNVNNYEIKNISVVDINGRVVKNESGAMTQINVSDLNAGVYFVTIEAAEGKITKKFIKQ
ncbi:T9SS type A sorting domain-containing protein [Flavobacterium sp. HXWNR69]|uniref:T9SS type A sorting domain-containing protein n=1 Tax=Flavobacterium fragile TaxID=2949085 RepID=A0ABT0TK86_9FLAO|nr:T9SS type A sorting domain-containing protein [Flavobacterium sp. HXWNR69]MCL9770986.1 T9SS type A sorting domain-containing protein [Flavobacterium sp. HXWNR69]